MASTSRTRPAQPSLASTARTKPAQQPLARRLLFPVLPASDPLPPLLASSSTSPELTAELYDLIALALRAFVTPWWSKISRYDKELLPDITRILTAVVRALEARALAIDLPLLLLCHLPAIVTQHYRDHRNAAAKLSTSYASGGAASLPQLFHQLQPHMAISSDGRIDTEYFRQVVDHILKVSLPEEDYQPEAERFIVREIVLKVILNDVIPKITQPWFIQRIVLDFLQPGPAQDIPMPQESSPPSSFSFQALLVIFLSAIQSMSGACLALIHAYKQTLSTIKRINKSHTPPHSVSPSIPISSPALSQSQSSSHIHPLSSPTSSFSSISTSFSTIQSLSPAPLHPHHSSNFLSTPLILFAEVFTTRDRLASTIFLTTLRTLAALSSSFLDRLLPHLLMMHLLSPSVLLVATRTTKRSLFPNGYPAPPPPDPTPEEQAETRARLVGWRPTGALAHLAPIVLGPDPSHTLRAALDPLGSAPCNAHLILLLLECALSALFPELVGGDIDVDEPSRSEDA